MEITFLGTSSAVHSQNRSHPAIALRAFGEVMLFDCGESTQKQLIYAKISPMKISKIFLSHFHGDHILGLPGLLQSMNFRGREKSLSIYGPKGLNKLMDTIKQLGFSEFDFPIEVIEVENGTLIETDDYIIKAKKMKHNVISFAYSITEKKKPKFLREKAIELGVPVGPLFGKLHNGHEIEVDGKIIKPEQVLGEPKKAKKIVYSGDTIPCKEMIEFAEGANLLIHESTYTLEDNDKAIQNFHSTSSDAAQIAAQANVEKLILTHFSTRYKDTNDMISQARQEFKNSHLAKDLMVVDV
ncbi:MAG: ribonuclease Z [Methanobrevibacter sp.]|uniref:ribonuclease Z n=1 Tax=Methanobrevibacter sp. TaxID=66852 RepID=UPI0026E05883|nr:ribonuclease Z [Methanobrevibacter sp.]MDO5848953.1 ribonuclease Z [Methanobrevibacter sp.]